MKFGPVTPDDAWGAIVAHSVKLPDGSRLKKGRVMTGNDVQTLKDNGIAEIIVAITEDGEIPEDAAATIISESFPLAGMRKDLARTGRINFFSDVNGVFQVNRELVNQINGVDPAITFATLDDRSEVNDGRIVATIKIIPYAIPLVKVEEIADHDLSELMKVSPYSAKKVGLVSTELPTLKPTVMDKTRKALEQRLGLSGSSVSKEVRVPHEAGAVSKALLELVPTSDVLIVFGASAICDINDVIPAAIRDAGGDIVRFGMPVDPGNLLLLAEIDGKPVLGAPGCARSPAENGFDWVLQQLLADIPVTSGYVSNLGVGGLLMETGARPHPRQKSEDEAFHVAAIVLAAGQSRRAGKINKLLAKLDGKPMVAHVAEAAMKSKATQSVAVTGHESDKVAEAIAMLAIEPVFNSEYETGLSSSLATGIRQLGESISHALVLLGDMPFVTTAMLDRLIEAARNSPESIVVATSNGKRGNPVLWPRRYFEELMNVDGDVGARHIIGANLDNVVEVELGDAVATDLDTREALTKAGVFVAESG